MNYYKNPELNEKLFFQQCTIDGFKFSNPRRLADLENLKHFKIHSKNILLSFNLPSSLRRTFHDNPDSIKKILQMSLIKNDIKIISLSFKLFKLPAISVSKDKNHEASHFYLIHILLDKVLSTRDRFYFHVYAQHSSHEKDVYFKFPPLQFYSGSFFKLREPLSLGRIKYNAIGVLTKKKKNTFRFAALNVRLHYSYDKELGDLSSQIEESIISLVKKHGLKLPISHFSLFNQHEETFESTFYLKLTRRLQTRNSAFFNLIIKNKDALIVPESWRACLREELLDSSI